MQFESLKRVPAYTMAENAIKELILSGKLGPGDLLPGEHDLAGQLGVTRPTVREAMRTLESTGLIERGHRRRMQVVAPSSDVSNSAIKNAIVMHDITYRELWEVSTALEPLAARMAAERVTPELLKRIEANLEHTRTCLDDPKALVQADIEFHELVTQASGNHALQLARAPLSDFLSAAYVVVTQKLGPGERLLKAHETIYAALARGDADTAEEWMAKHFRDFLRGCELAGLDVDDSVRKITRKWKVSNP